MKLLRKSYKLYAVFNSVGKNESASVTAEFVIILPIALAVLLFTIESGMTMARWAMLERSVSMVSRDLRINGVIGEKDPNETTHNYLKSQICKELIFEEKCSENLVVEVTNINIHTGKPNVSKSCIDKVESVNPLLNFPHVDPGDRGTVDTRDIRYLRACYFMKPILLSVFKSPFLKVQENGIAMVVDSAFVNEPL
jgi:hypothetical protein